jgi:predicted transcriptional regulator
VKQASISWKIEQHCLYRLDYNLIVDREGHLYPVRREAGMTPERTRRRSNDIRLKALLPLVGLLLMSSAPFFSQDAEARPAMGLEMSLSRTDVQSLNIFACTIRFDNTGRSPASLVWINVTLPDGIVYLSDNAGHERGVKLGDHSWRFSIVSVGEHSYSISLQVTTAVDDGDVLTIRGHLDYHDKFLVPMPLEDSVSLTISKPTWDMGEPASFEPDGQVGIVKGVTKSKPVNSTNSVGATVGHEDVGDTPPNDGEEEPPLPPPPVTTPGDPPDDIGSTPDGQSGPEEENEEERMIGPIDPPPNRPGPTGTIERPDDKVDDDGLESYVSYEPEEEDEKEPAIDPPNVKADPYQVSSNIISNNKVYRTGDIMSFTIFINNTGSRTSGMVTVKLTTLSLIRFLNDTTESLGGRSLGQMTYVFNDVVPGNYEFLIFFIFEGEVQESTEVEVWVHVSYTDSKGDFVGGSTHMASCSVVPDAGQFPMLQVSIAILSAGLMSVVAFSTKKLGAHSLLPFFVPLYSRLKRNEILNHEARDVIIGYIKENPGEHFNSLKSKLDFRNGTLAHHLHILERERVIKSVRYGKYRRFFPMGMIVSRKSYPTELEQEILEVVRVRPGINQKTIARKVGKSKSTVNYHIDKLRKSNKIRTEKNGLSLKHYVVETEL